MNDPHFTAEEFLAWAKTKPQDERYCYGSNENCAVAQFLRETGRAKHPTVGSMDWSDWTEGPFEGDEGPDHLIPQELCAYVLAEGRQTFSALVERVEAKLLEAA